MVDTNVSSLMRILLSPYFLILCIIYAINKYFQSNFRGATFYEVFLKNHLNDVLFIPIVLIICLAFVRLIKRSPKLLLDMYIVWLMTIFYSILFEFIAPFYFTHSIADVIDVIMYAIGALIFLLIQRLNKY